MGVEIREVILRKFYKGADHALAVSRHLIRKAVGFDFMPSGKIVENGSKREGNYRADKTYKNYLRKEGALLQMEEMNEGIALKYLK